jgi:hypothetical protein
MQLCILEQHTTSISPMCLRTYFRVSLELARRHMHCTPVYVTSSATDQFCFAICVKSPAIRALNDHVLMNQNDARRMRIGVAALFPCGAMAGSGARAVDTSMAISTRRRAGLPDT